MSSWIATALRPDVTRRAMKVALVVGILLALINHTDALLGAAAFTTTRALQIVLTFLVPYCVSTFASVQAIRVAEAGRAPRTAPDSTTPS